MLELLITIAVVGITITLGAPAIIDAFKSQQVKGATQNGYFMLQYARSVAISKGSDVTIDFVSGNNWCVGISDAGACDCGVANSCLIDGVEQRVAFTDYNDVKMQNLAFAGGTSVIDGMRGMSVGNAGSFELSDGTNTLRLVMSNLGRVRICAVAGNVGDYPAC